MATYASLSDVHYELQLASTNTQFDNELNDLLAKGDIMINLRMQKYTSLPVNSDIAGTLAQIEARWVAYKFKQRRATPKELTDFQRYIGEVEAELDEFLSENFQTSLTAVNQYSENRVVYNDGRPGIWNQYPEGQY